jgi:hypothetical protein
MRKGQTTTTLLVSIASLLGSGLGIGFLYNSIASASDVNLNQAEDIATLKELTKCIPEMKSEIKNTNENVIKLMYSMKVEPVSRTLASSTNKDAGK